MIYIFSLVLFFSCTISGVVGFGNNIIALPFLSLFLDIKLIVPVLLVVTTLNGLPRLLCHYQSIHLPCYFTILPFAVAGSFVGVHLVTVLHEGWMKVFLAVLMILIGIKGLLELHGYLKIVKHEKRNPLLIAFPFMAGIMQSAFSCGGPLYNMYIVMNLEQKDEIRSTQYAISLTTSMLAIIQYINIGVYQSETIRYIIFSIPVVILAYVVSEKLFYKMDSGQFTKLIYIVLLFAGCMTVWQATHLF